MRRELKRIVEQTDTRAGRVFDITIQILILASLVGFSLETLPRLSADQHALLYQLEVVIIIVFSLEFLLRLFVADNALRYMFSFWGIIDLLAILPFYLSTGLDLRSLRIFRLLRIFRILKLARYNRAIRRFSKAFRDSREELVLFLSAALFIVYLAAVGIYYFEHEIQPEAFSSILDGLWWAVATLTTVGYGDVYPVTAGGRLFTVLILVVGLGVVSIPAGIVASSLTAVKRNEAAGGSSPESAERKTEPRSG